MNQNRSLAIVLSTASISLAHGALTVNEWNVNDTSKWNFSVVGSTITITITQSDADTFSFEAYDNVTLAPANIDTIVVASGVTGTVRVSVLQSPTNNPGGVALFNGETRRGGVALFNLQHETCHCSVSSVSDRATGAPIQTDHP